MDDLHARVKGLMPQLKTELAELVAMPSISEVGYPPGSDRGHEPGAGRYGR